MHKPWAGSQEKGKGLCGRKGTPQGRTLKGSCVRWFWGANGMKSTLPTAASLCSNSARRPRAGNLPGAREGIGTPRAEVPSPLADSAALCHLLLGSSILGALPEHSPTTPIKPGSPPSQFLPSAEFSLLPPLSVFLIL